MPWYFRSREPKFQGTKVPGSESSWNFRSLGAKFLGAKVSGSKSSWNFRSWERKFQGAKVPGSKSSWNFRSREQSSRERKFLGVKVPVTVFPQPIVAHLLSNVVNKCDMLTGLEFSSVQFSKAICIAQLSRMSHCALAARKPVHFKFTPETRVGDVLVA